METDNPSMPRLPSPAGLLQQSELLFTEQQVNAAIGRIAEQITLTLAESRPVALCVMTGGAVFAGKLLPLLDFPLEFDYVQASRYRNSTQGHEIVWAVQPKSSLAGRTVLLLDDILDEGLTLVEVVKKCRDAGAVDVRVAVMTEKDTGRVKPIQADFVGLTVPDRYVFGCGMDVHGWWRNLPAIYALK